MATTRTTFRMRGAQVIGVLAVAGYVAGVQWASQTGDYDLWGGLVFIPLLILVSLHLITRASLGERELLTLLFIAFTVKALGTVARYVMTFVVYDGSADAASYNYHGMRLAESYRDGEFDADIGRELIGTGFIRVLTGILYAVTGPSIYAAYAFYAWLSFWGLYFLYRAFRTGVPSADTKRYAALVFFLPSMVFWPSSLGKDAWMTFGIGLTAFGAARLLAGQQHRLILLSSGLVATAVVRPPITAALFAGIAVALVLRRAPRPSTAFTPLVRAGALVVIIAVGLLVMKQAATFIGADEVSVSSVESFTEQTEEQTSKGGSEFAADSVSSPLEMPWAIISVLCRPFLFEANSGATLIAAAEGTLILGLLVLSVPRLRGILGRLRDNPYLIVCVVYALLFVYGYSNISNFGILARQRVQVLPFVLVFLALPLIQSRSTKGKHRHAHEEISA